MMYNDKYSRTTALHEMCPYSEFLWSIFSRIRTEYEDILRISPYSIRMRENTDQKTPNTNTFQAVLVTSIFSEYP